MSKGSVFTAALLYSNTCLEDKNLQCLLNKVKRAIQQDEKLSKSINLVCIDNTYCRNILKYNNSGVTVHHWPVFIIRWSDKSPEIYPLSSFEEVFKQVGQVYSKFEDRIPVPIVSWNLDKFSEPGSLNVILGKSIRFVSSDGLRHTLNEVGKKNKLEPVLNLDRIVTFNKIGVQEISCTVYPEMKLYVNVIDDEDCKHVDWNKESFNGAKRINVKYGDIIRFTSNEGKDDVILADKDWKHINTLVPARNNLDALISVDKEIFPNPGCHNLTSSKNRSTIRLVMCITDTVDDVLDGMIPGMYNQEEVRKKDNSSGSHIIRLDKNQINKMIAESMNRMSSEPKFKTFAQRRNAQKKNNV